MYFVCCCKRTVFSAICTWSFCYEDSPEYASNVTLNIMRQNRGNRKKTDDYPADKKSGINKKDREK